MSFLSQPLENVLIRPKRMIGSIAVQVVVDEHAVDHLTITKQPVQQGASITDHAYMEPTTFAHTIYFAAPGITGGVSLAKIYQQLQDLQSSLMPFDIVTPKRTYKNMLFEDLSQSTDKQTENCLAIHASYRQVLFVQISAGSVPRIKQKNPAKTGATTAAGPKSALFQASGNQSLGDIIGKFFGGGG